MISCVTVVACVFAEDGIIKRTGTENRQPCTRPFCEKVSADVRMLKVEFV